MTSLSTLHTVIGSTSPFMANFQPVKSFPLKSSIWALGVTAVASAATTMGARAIESAKANRGATNFMRIVLAKVCSGDSVLKKTRSRIFVFERSAPEFRGRRGEIGQGDNGSGLGSEPTGGAISGTQRQRPRRVYSINGGRRRGEPVCGYPEVCNLNVLSCRYRKNFRTISRGVAMIGGPTCDARSSSERRE
jgi:hypothetical protein